MRGQMDYNGVPIHTAPMLPPDFYSIRDWDRPRETAIPEWMKFYCIENPMAKHAHMQGIYSVPETILYAHPTLIEQLEKLDLVEIF